MAQQVTDEFDTNTSVEKPHRERVAKVVGAAAIKGQPALATLLLVEVTNCRMLDWTFRRTQAEEKLGVSTGRPATAQAN